ncbi:MAG: hypothetical protein JSV88_26590 [Candidatus Aminicenantes bacterium]|nr:MAG: hypothetical protein JSV88_26590 [Candidatus Aminicenantes bacterium]
MQNEKLESQLLKLFSQPTRKTKEDYLIEKVEGTHLTIYEKEKSGEYQVSFKNGCFIRFSEKMLGTNKIIALFNKRQGDVMRRICDGIFLARLNDKIILCLVELKNNINNNFERAIKQIEGSYLKTAMLLSLLCNIKEIELRVFIGDGLEKIVDDPDIDYLEKVEEFREKADNLESKLKEFSHKREVQINFPFFLGDSIHESYQKKDINVYHLQHGDTFDMQIFN